MPGAVFLDDEGHLVVEDGEGRLVWKSWRGGRAGGRLTVTDNGRVLIRTGRGRYRWACCRGESSPPPAVSR
jgi:hypothetical protein